MNNYHRTIDKQTFLEGQRKQEKLHSKISFNNIIFI